MGNNSNSIDINGKRYDAVTGKFLGNTSDFQQTTRKAMSVDGFQASRRSPMPDATTRRQDESIRAAQPVITDLTNAKPLHAPAKHIRPHHPQQAKTLMRTAVKKPEIVAPSRLKALHRTDVLAKVPQHTVSPKISQTSVDPKRLKKATQMVQSPAVSRYAPPRPNSSSVNIYASLAASAPHQPVDFQPVSNPTYVSPAHRATAHIPVAPVRQQVKQPDIFEQAMAAATSHENTYTDKRDKKRRRWTSVLSFGMGLFLIAGVIAYMNAPALSMRMAASRAGFDAKLPGYSPAGFAFGNLSYGPGNVTVSYTAGENSDRKFDITQKVSDWDSQALLTNFVSSANKAYQTYERAGRTIYFYGNNTATWVDSGVWYTVNGNNSLSKNQLLDMAGSL